MISFGANTRVYLAAGATDMRKAVNGLMILVEDELEVDPFSSHLFVFCNRLHDKIKIIYWAQQRFLAFLPTSLEATILVANRR